MTRGALLALAAAFVAGAVAVAAARLLGRSGSRASILASVAAQWLGAWVLWNFAGGLAIRYGLLAAYDAPLFAALALPAGLWHYRTRVSAGAAQARAVFVGAQLAWLLIVLARNGLFAS